MRWSPREEGLEAFYLRRTIAIAVLSLVVVGVGAPRPAGARDEEGPKASPPIDLDDISRELDNPLTNLWSLTFENKVLVEKGNATADRELANTLFFQPGLPIPFGKNQDMVFIARPVFPIVTVPVLDPTQPDGVNGKATGFGDLQMLSLFGPNRKDGVVWGLGLTAKFPTHSDDALGIDKYQAGPAAMLFSIGRPWVFGALVQSWFSYAGDSSANSAKQTDIQYVIRYALPHAWSVGTGPTISIDWERGSGDKLTLPVGLGLTKTVKIGRFPVKFRAEAHYSVVRPDDFGTEWTFVFRFAPVIPSPFSR